MIKTDKELLQSSINFLQRSNFPSREFIDCLNFSDPIENQQIRTLLADLGESPLMMDDAQLRICVSHCLESGTLSINQSPHSLSGRESLGLISTFDAHHQFASTHPRGLGTINSSTTSPATPSSSNNVLAQKPALAAAISEIDDIYDLHIVLEYKHNTVVDNKLETLTIPVEAQLSGGAAKEYDSKGSSVSHFYFSKLPKGDYSLDMAFYNLENRSLK